MKEIQSYPCPYCHDETPYARAYGVDYRTYWCPTCHEYVDVDDLEEYALTTRRIRTMKPSINQIMTTFMDCASPKDFDSILRKFNAFNIEDRHWIRSRICRLVKQKYIIKVAVNEWMFNDAYRNLRACVDEETEGAPR